MRKFFQITRNIFLLGSPLGLIAITIATVFSPIVLDYETSDGPILSVDPFFSYEMLLDVLFGFFFLTFVLGLLIAAVLEIKDYF